MSKNYKFSTKFENIHIQAEQVISSHVARLNSISNDIKALEDVLSRAGIPFTFNYLIREEIEYFDESIISHALEWDKKRLLFHEYFKGGLIEGLSVHTTPLIETKAHVRLSIEEELPIFYKSIIAILEKDPQRAHVHFKSPNYKKPTKPSA